MPSTDAKPDRREPPDIESAGGTARPPVFLASAADLAGPEVVLRGREGRHASTVRRLGPGERVDLTDGAGTLAECIVAAARPGELELTVHGRINQPRPQPLMTVVQAIPKGERGELAVELLTEVGVDVIIPWAAQRCVAVWRGDRAVKARDRWQAAAQEAVKQSRRSWLPEVTGQADLTAVSQRVADSDLAVLLDPGAEVPLAGLPVPATGEIVVIVGPEGGVTTAERDRLTAAGALGPLVLTRQRRSPVSSSGVAARTSSPMSGSDWELRSAEDPACLLALPHDDEAAGVSCRIRIDIGSGA
jgi:16S rRNA (uracil1498-N3)-methyltransferase